MQVQLHCLLEVILRMRKREEPVGICMHLGTAQGSCLFTYHFYGMIAQIFSSLQSGGLCTGSQMRL